MSETTTMTMSTVIGVDLGKRHSQVCLVCAGKVILERSIRSTRKAIREYFEELPRGRVVMEVGGSSPWLSRLLKELGFEVMVIVPTALKELFRERQKNDRADARALALLAERVPEKLRTVTHRCEARQRHTALLVQRDTMVRARTMFVNQVRGMTASLGVELPSCSSESFPRRAWKALGEEDRKLVMRSLRQIARLTHDIRSLECELEAIAQAEYKETLVLRQVKGVGLLTALAFVLMIGDPRRFKRNRLIGSYLGLVPKQEQSGESDPQLGITKRGNMMLRRLLVQAGHYIIGPFGPDTDLRRFGLAIAGRGDSKSKRIAVIAVARRLSVLLLALMKTGEVYAPLRNATRGAETASA